MIAPTLQTGQWHHMWDAFHQAVDLGGADRARFLAGLGDPALRRELESLLAAHSSDDPLLGTRALDTWVIEGPSLIGRWVGPYRVVEEIGHGGMGTVYLAERDDQEYQRRVAVKVVRRGMDTAEIVARFRQERQILASLDHPNIARLLDGGTTADGLPFFVMEHIEGEPIDRHCARLGLSLDRRLELFATVCEAVRYAHRNLIVHRDLKPSNILVTADGLVKLLDFGIAKLLDPASPGLTTTLAPARRMTPEFASPEQLRGGPVTTASDVYALGVLLYLLLTGRTPLQSLAGRRRDASAVGSAGGDVAAEPSVEAVARAVCEGEPEAPSVLVRRRPQPASGDPSGDPSGPDARELAGDLDNIALMALEKQPDRRYLSVEQLAADLRRYREGLPVTARRGGRLYRLGKFVRRYRRGVAAAVFTLLVVLGFAVHAAVQARRTARALSLAEAESRRTEQVLRVLVNQFRIADPGESRGDTITAREVLERGVERIREELGDQPAVQAELLHAIGQVHHNLGLYAQAAELMGESLAIRRRPAHALLPAEGPEIIDGLSSLAVVQHELGDYKRAAALHRHVLHLRRRQLGEEHLKVAESLDGLAVSLQAHNDYLTAERHLRRALEIHRLHPDEGHEQLVRILRHLGSLLWERGDFDGAKPLLLRALSLSRATFGDEHQEVADAQHVLGMVAYGKGDFESAEVRYRAALTLRRKLFGSDHPDVALILTALCAVASDRGDLVEAEGFCREALATQRRMLGDEHPTVTQTVNNLALLLHQKGDYDEAERLYRENLAVNRKLRGKEHWRVATNLNNLALLLHDRGDLAAAEPLYREALVVYRKALGEEHHWAGFSLNNLGRLFHDRGDHRAAETLYLEALALRRAALPANHPQVASSLSWLGKLYVDAGEPMRGEPLLREALEHRRASLAPGDWRTAETESLLGHCLALQGRFADAEPLVTGSYPVLLARRSKADRRAVQAVERAVELYRRWGRPEEAERVRVGANQSSKISSTGTTRTASSAIRSG